MSPFSDLFHEEYIHKIKVLDQNAKKQKIELYNSKKEEFKDFKSSTFSKSYRKLRNQSESDEDKGSDNASSLKSEKDTDKNQMSKKEMRKKDICFNCH